MIVRNLESEDVKQGWYVAHGGGLATMLLDSSVLQGILFFAFGVTKPGKAGEVHMDAYEEIYYLLQGKGIITVGDERREVKAGDAIWLPHGVPHGLENNGEEDLVMVVTAAMPRPY